MTWTDLSRRAATVILVALCINALPAIANAQFTSKQSADQQVGTDRMETPIGVSGTYSCDRGSSSETIQVTVLSFTDNGPAGASYSYRLTRGAIVADTAFTTSKVAQLDGSKTKDHLATTWTVTIQSSLRNWTGGTYTKSITCPATGDRDGYL